jgi:hypothetical protein
MLRTKDLFETALPDKAIRVPAKNTVEYFHLEPTQRPKTNL